MTQERTFLAGDLEAEHSVPLFHLPELLLLLDNKGLICVTRDKPFIQESLLSFGISAELVHSGG